MSPFNKLIKFGVVGVFATLIHVVIASYLIEGSFQISVPMANIVAFLVATTFSYIGNTKWSFSDHFNRGNASRFAVTASVGCLCAYCLSWLADTMGFHYLIGIGLIVLCIPVLTFLSHYYWTYQKSQ